METTFFKQIEQMDITGNLQMTISNGAGNNLIVSLILQNEQCGDTDKKLIPPMILKGTAEELDEGFFESITTPLLTTSSLMVNMETYIKQLETVQKQPAMEKDKSDKEKTTKNHIDKKYQEAMTKADELDKKGRPRDAWMKIPNAKDYPEHAEAIHKRKKELSDKFISPSLFGTEQENV